LPSGFLCADYMVVLECLPVRLLYLRFLGIGNIEETDSVRDQLLLHVLVNLGVVVEGRGMVHFQEKWLEFFVYQDVKTEQFKT
jgi:hypothetical protein